MHRGMWGASVSTSPLTTSNHLNGYSVINVNGTAGVGSMTGMTNDSNNLDSNTYAFASPNSSSMKHLLGTASPPNNTISAYGMNTNLSRERPQEVCKYFVNGGCLRGASCPYSHELPDERHLDVNGLGFIFNPNVHNAEKGVAVTQSSINSSQTGHLSPTSVISPLTLALNNHSNGSKVENYIIDSTNFYSGNNMYNNHIVDGSEHDNNNLTAALNCSRSQNNNNKITSNINSCNSVSKNRKSSIAAVNNSITGSRNNEEVASLTQLKSISNTNFAVNSGITNSTSVTTNTTLNNFTNVSNSSQSSLPVSISSTPNMLSTNSVSSPINTNTRRSNVSPFISDMTYNCNLNNVNSKNNNNNNSNNCFLRDGVRTGANSNEVNEAFITMNREVASSHDYSARAESVNVKNLSANDTLSDEVKKYKQLVRPKYRPPEPFLEYNLPPVLALPLKVPADDFADNLTNAILQ